MKVNKIETYELKYSKYWSDFCGFLNTVSLMIMNILDPFARPFLKIHTAFIKTWKFLDKVWRTIYVFQVVFELLKFLEMKFK